MVTIWNKRAPIFDEDFNIVINDKDLLLIDDWDQLVIWQTWEKGTDWRVRPALREQDLLVNEDEIFIVTDQEDMIEIDGFVTNTKWSKRTKPSTSDYSLVINDVDLLLIDDWDWVIIGAADTTTDWRTRVKPATPILWLAEEWDTIIAEEWDDIII